MCTCVCIVLRVSHSNTTKQQAFHLCAYLRNTLTVFFFFGISRLPLTFLFFFFIIIATTFLETVASLSYLVSVLVFLFLIATSVFDFFFLSIFPLFATFFWEYGFHRVVPIKLRDKHKHIHKNYFYLFFFSSHIFISFFVFLFFLNSVAFFCYLFYYSVCINTRFFFCVCVFLLWFCGSLLLSSVLLLFSISVVSLFLH